MIKMKKIKKNLILIKEEKVFKYIRDFLTRKMLILI